MVRVRAWVPFLLLVGLLAAIVFVLSPRGRAWTEALALLSDVWTIGSAPADTAEALPRALSYAGPAGEPRHADLWCDDGAPAGGRLVLVHGLVEAGKDDARLRDLGRAFARHRFLVVVPDFPGMRALRASPLDIDEVEAALRAARSVAACPGGPLGNGTPAAAAVLPTGIVGFSYSAGPTLLGAARAGETGADFAVLFGGYYDLRDVILFLTTGAHRDRGVEARAEALPEGRWVVLEANAHGLADATDAAALVEIARLRRAGRDAESAPLAALLGPAGRALLELIENDAPARFEALYAGLDPSLRALIDTLSPARMSAATLPFDLYVLHGRADRIVPYTQSLKLRRHLRTEGRVRLALLGGFRHARPAAPAESGVRSALGHPADSWRLVAILAEILGRRNLTGPGLDRR